MSKKNKEEISTNLAEKLVLEQRCFTNNTNKFKIFYLGYNA